MTLALGLVALFTAALLLGGVALVLARVGRPPAEPDFAASDGLSRFFPMGGRHRLPVRGFETAALVATTTGGLGLLLFVADGADASETRVATLALLASVLVLGVWWSWRRGVLRPARQSMRERERSLHG